MSVALVCSLVACTGPEAEWAAEAEKYFADIHTSWNSGFANLGTFFAPEATIDTHPLTGMGPVPGRIAGVAFLRDAFSDEDPQWHLECHAEEPPYLSADGAIDPSRITFGPTVPQAPVYEFAGTSGAARMTWTGSEQSARMDIGLRPEPVDRVVEGYVRMWGQGQPTPEIYAAGATVRDTLHEVSLTGSQISDAAAAGAPPRGLRGASLREIPDDEGPAVYVVPDEPLPVVVVLLDLPGKGACQPHVGAALWLDGEGRITREERYHRVDSVRACLDTQDLPGGWWETLAQPAAHVTGTEAVAGNEVTVWNVTPHREALLRWALQRFADAGLPAPAPTSVTFLPPVADPWSTYDFDRGAPDLVLPSTAEGCDAEGCQEWPASERTFVLTELARRWVADAASLDRLAGFAEARGLEWAGRGALQSQPAIDLAAATVAWGLMDQPYAPPDTLAEHACDQLAADFQVLTLASTSGAACPPAGG
ncbi:MAG TPA: hypothetical protein VLQ92_09705 [Candidatus Limnocylindrales bacterium]|nr:hypothetical protein [Candidatus Limnocylindrales bacterium]